MVPADGRGKEETLWLCALPKDHVERETQRQGWHRASAQGGSQCSAYGVDETPYSGWRYGVEGGGSDPHLHGPRLSCLRGPQRVQKVLEHSLEFLA